jgi:fibronectin type 3 domain-containing protein
MVRPYCLKPDLTGEGVMMIKISGAFLIMSLLVFSGCSNDDNPVTQVNGFIGGRVTADGQGLAGVTITVSSYVVSSGKIGKPESILQEASSGAAGDYRIELPAGQYRIDFSITLDGEFLFTARYPVEVAARLETTVNVDMKDPAPANLIARDDDASVLLTWEHGYGAQSYRIYRSPQNQGDFHLVGETDQSPGTVSAVDIPAAVGSYVYRVSSVIDDVESAPSNTASVEFTGSINAPTEFRALDQISHVALSWRPKENAAYFKVYRSAIYPDNWVIIDSTAQSGYSDIPDQYETFYYYVTAMSTFGTESEPSTSEAVLFDGRYDPPTDLTLIDRGSNFYLTWLANNTAGYYNVYRSIEEDEGFSRIDSVAARHYEDSPTIHQDYYYRVTIVGPNGLESDPSEAVGAYFDGRLDPPDQVMASDMGLYVTVTWSEVPYTGAYILYRSDDGSTYPQIARISAGTLEYDDIPSETGEYFYKVSTETVDGFESQLSQPAGVYFTDNLMRPENVVAENFGTFVEVTWDEVYGATEYYIYRSNSAEGGYVQIGSASQLSFINVPQQAGPLYYKVRAADDIGHVSPFSFYAYTYYSDRPLPPFDIEAIDLLHKVMIDWDSYDPAYDFIVYRAGSPEGEYLPVDTVETLYDTDWPAAAGHLYYKIQAMWQDAILSDLSEYVHVYFSGLLDPPSDLNADTTGGYVSLSWNSVEGASEYDVYRGDSPDIMVLIQTVYDTAATDAPEAGGTYFYAVAARTQGGLESPRSAPVVVEYNP